MASLVGKGKRNLKNGTSLSILIGREKSLNSTPNKMKIVLVNS
jgi:hypothetical protein